MNIPTMQKARSLTPEDVNSNMIRFGYAVLFIGIILSIIIDYSIIFITFIIFNVCMIKAVDWSIK